MMLEKKAKAASEVPKPPSLSKQQNEKRHRRITASLGARLTINRPRGNCDRNCHRLKQKAGMVRRIVWYVGMYYWYTRIWMVDGRKQAICTRSSTPPEGLM